MADPLKVFLGSLTPSICKPNLHDLFSRLSLKYAGILVPQCHGQLAIAFVTFNSADQAQLAVETLHGLFDPEISPSTIKAHRVVIMGIFISC